MSQSPVRYTIAPIDPNAHLFRVRCDVAQADPAGQRFAMAAWIPGSYMIRDFSRHVVRFAARNADGPVAAVKIDKQTWQCAPAGQALTIEYDVYAWDLSVRAAHLDQTHGYFNGPAVFMLPLGLASAPCQVDIQPPAGADGWRVATALSPLAAAPFGFGVYQADNFDALIDCPVEMGRFEHARFMACGVPHEIVMTGRHRADLAVLADDLRVICEHHIRFFGEPAPMRRYVFLITATGSGYGGLEHRASTSLLCARDALPASAADRDKPAYREFLGLVSHEYFHTWNVKRIKPAVFHPYDLFNENYTRQLWAFEGITSYYDDLALARSGLINETHYLEQIERAINRVRSAPGRLLQSVADSSFDAWIKFYRPDENAPNAIVNYYVKGSLIALALDLALRRDTAGTRSLDDVMRALWQRHGLTGEGVPEGGVESIAMEVGGESLHGFLQTAIHGTDELPLGALLASVGLTLEAADPAAAQRPALGIILAPGAGARLQSVLTGSPAQLAGLSAGDEIVAVDGLRADAGTLPRLIEALPLESTVRMHAFRRDELMVFDVTLKASSVPALKLRIDETAPPAAHAARAAWLTAAG